MKKFKGEKEVAIRALDAAVFDIRRFQQELEEARDYVDCLYFFKRKDRLYPLKKKKIYQ